jgi:hypothetical protein
MEKGCETISSLPADDSPLEEDLDEIRDVDEKALLRRIDWRIVPIMFFCYIMQFVDKVLVNVRWFALTCVDTVY